MNYSHLDEILLPEDLYKRAGLNFESLQDEVQTTISGLEVLKKHAKLVENQDKIQFFDFVLLLNNAQKNFCLEKKGVTLKYLLALHWFLRLVVIEDHIFLFLHEYQ